MFGLKIKNSYLAEINLTGTIAIGNFYSFKDQPDIRFNEVKIVGIQTFTATHLATSPDQKTVIADAGAASLVVSFAAGQGNTIEIDKVPYYDLISGNNSGLIRMFNDKRINLTKSGVQVVSTSNLTTGYSVIFNFIYEKLR